jgi:hypothetical protein
MDRTKVEMDALTTDQFADPVHRKFPVVDQSDFDFVMDHYKEALDPAKVKATALVLAKANALTVDGKALMSECTVKFGEIGSNAVQR